MTPPVPQPRVRILPFDDDAFDWNRFESFCLAVVRSLPDVKRADRYGKTGEAQAGIDIEAELADGRRRTIQCRHRKTVTKPQLEKTVRETTFEADEHEIWITGSVGKPATDYILGLDDWMIQSAEGISQTLRLEIPRERARRIVEDAFGPAVSRAFLGIRSGLVAPEDHFAAFDEPDRLLRQDLDLVGRTEELVALISAVTDETVKVVVLPGRGGIGKTRLLRAAAEQLWEGAHVLFVADASLISHELVEDLPLEPVVVFLDDAHRSDVNLGPLLAASLRRPDPLTVVLGLRPAGLDEVRAAGAAVGIEPQQMLVLPRLRPLEEEQVRELARQASGEDSERTRRLAEATELLPLLTVLGGRLIARDDLDPQAQGKQLRSAVLQRFVAEQRGRISDRVPADQAQRLLELLAALNPLDVSNKTLIEAIADDLGVAASQVRRWIGDIEDAGLLLTRRDLRRLTPDVLADEVLYEACLDQKGRPTGYAEELWRRYSPEAASQLLANLGELDWRTPEDQRSLLADVWNEITARFRAADAWGRENLIDTVAPAAFKWPVEALALVDVALAEPAAPSDWGIIGVRIVDESVRAKLPTLLRAVGAHPVHARAAMDRLWSLARDDSRQTNPFPDHPLRVLLDLGGYESGRAQPEALLDMIEARLGDPDVDDHANSPLPLVDTLLSREGTRARSSGLAWRLDAYLIDPEATRPLRERVRDLLVDQALHGTPRQRALAAKTFGDALQIPYGYFGHPVPDELVDAWLPDQTAILDAIERVAQSSKDPVVRVLLRQAVDWHAEHGRWKDISELAATLIEKLAGPEEELVAAVATPWSILDEEEKSARNQAVAGRLIEAHSTGGQLAQALDDLLEQIIARQVSENPSVDSVLSYVFRSSPDHARQLWDWVMDNPASRIACSAADALSGLRRSGQDVTERLDAAWGSGEPILRRIAASYLCSGSWFDRPESREIELLEEMTGDADEVVRNITSTTILRLRSHDPALSVRLAVRARIEPGDRRSADMLFSTVDDYGVANLGADDLDRVVEHLIEVSTPKYFAHKLLASLGELDPERVIDVWSRRLGYERADDDPRYDIVPSHDYGVEMLGGASGAGRTALHVRLLDVVLGLGSWAQRQAGRVYWRLAVPGLKDDVPDDERLAFRQDEIAAALAGIEHLVATDAEGSTVERLLSEIPWQILISRPEWVASLLSAAAAPRRPSIMQGLRDAAISGVQSRTVGEDSPRWLATLAAAEAALLTLPSGPAVDLYTDFARWARRELSDDRQEDDAEREGWQ